MKDEKEEGYAVQAPEEEGEGEGEEVGKDVVDQVRASSRRGGKGGKREKGEMR